MITTRTRRTLLAAVTGAAVFVSLPAAAEEPQMRESVVESETIAIVGTIRSTDLAPGFPYRVSSASGRWELEEALDANTVTAEVLAAVDEVLAGDDDDVALVGLIASGCFLADGVTVVRPGPSTVPFDVMLRAEFDEAPDPNVRCVAAQQSIAVVKVSAPDVPPGGADQAVLVHFEQVEQGEGGATLAAASLPELDGRFRRIAVEFSGCQEQTAELVMTASGVRAMGGQLDGSRSPDCARAEYFVAVFDVWVWVIPTDVPITGELDITD